MPSQLSARLMKYFCQTVCVYILVLVLHQLTSIKGQYEGPGPVLYDQNTRPFLLLYYSFLIMSYYFLLLHDKKKPRTYLHNLYMCSLHIEINDKYC